MTTLGPASAQARNHYANEGNIAPISAEFTETDSEVIGKIPVELSSRYVGNGPNPVTPVDSRAHHWLSEHGMVHGVRLGEGRACWYRNRWVQDLLIDLVTVTTPKPAAPCSSGPGDHRLSLASVHGGPSSMTLIRPEAQRGRGATSVMRLVTLRNVDAGGRGGPLTWHDCGL